MNDSLPVNDVNDNVRKIWELLSSQSTDAPEGSSGPLPPQAAEGGLGDHDRFLNERMENYDKQSAGRPRVAEKESDDDYKRRAIGTAASALLGGLINRKRRGGFLGGAAAAGGGFNNTVMERGDAQRAARAKSAEAGEAHREAYLKDASKSFYDMLKSRGEKKGNMPESYRIWEAGKNNPEYGEWYDKNKPGAAEKEPPGVAEFRAVHGGRAPKDAVEYLKFKRAPASPMELFYFNELDPKQQEKYLSDRGEPSPVVYYDAKGNKVNSNRIPQ